MQDSQPLETIAAHAASLQNIDGEQFADQIHADVRARRKTETEDHKLRSFVAKHSVFRIHGLVAGSLILIAMTLWAPVRVQAGREVLLALIAVVTCGISASVSNIRTAVRNRVE